MASNEKLNRAKKAKNDEFYTQYKDIEKEMTLHKEHFKNKIIYCSCDDWEKSEFVHFFLDHFDDYELKGLIATSYAYANEEKRDLFNSEIKKGKVLVKTFDEVYYNFLEGDGDFRSDECTAFRNKADIIVTNPPFSLFREFFAWCKDKKIILVAPLNCMVYSNCFPSFMEGKVFLGSRVKSFTKPDGKEKKVNAFWVTSFLEEKSFLELTESYSPKKYPKYDNYNAIEVSKVKDIPKDYDGVMGVPVNFFEKYNPCQFEIVGACENRDLYGLKTRVYTSKECRNAYYKLFGKPGSYDLNATGVLKGKKLFKRILIRRKRA